MQRLDYKFATFAAAVTSLTEAAAAFSLWMVENAEIQRARLACTCAGPSNCLETLAHVRTGESDDWSAQGCNIVAPPLRCDVTAAGTDRSKHVESVRVSRPESSGADGNLDWSPNETAVALKFGSGSRKSRFGSAQSQIFQKIAFYVRH